MTFLLFIINVALYSIFPLFFSKMNSNLRKLAFYGYISIILFIGGLVGTVYSFPISENLIISAGSVAYGAFMMSTVMLIIVERDVTTFWNIIRMVIMVDLFVFLGFNFLSWILDSGLVLSPANVSSEIFNISLWVLILGGALILFEIFLLLIIFIQLRKFLSNLYTLALIYTLAFILILCLDGVLFPLLAFGFSPDLEAIIFGNVTSKFVMAICFSIPMLGFYLLFKQSFSQFVETPLTINELIRAPRKKLLETLSLYEDREQQLQREKKELIAISEIDELTSIANRRKFDQTFKAEWLRCQREEQPLTLVIGDIDFFKQYNDTYGHHQGDICLKKISLIWRGIFKRPSDIAARIGGEEFAIILPQISLEQTLSSLEYFLTVLKEHSIPHSASSVAPYVTMSIGVARCFPKRGSSPDELFVIADQRLYAAKQIGRNRVVAE